jgi:hypothetical protein
MDWSVNVITSKTLPKAAYKFFLKSAMTMCMSEALPYGVAVTLPTVPSGT